MAYEEPTVVGCRVVFIAVSLLAGVACTRGVSPPDRASARPCAPVPAAAFTLRDPGRAEPATLAIMRMEASLDSLGDPTHLFFARVQTPPRDFRGVSDTGAFPVEDVDVRAYAVGHGTPYHLADDCDLVAHDGTMCPSVTAPGVRLTEAQAARVVARVVASTAPCEGGGRRDALPVLHCGFDPDVAFVFFDSGGRPVGTVQVGLECGEWDVRPSPWGGSHQPMCPNEARSFADLCRELGLGACDAVGTRTDFDAWVAWHDSSDGIAARRRDVLARAPGVRGDAHLADLSEGERRALCAWYARAAAEGFDQRQADVHEVTQRGYRCDDGRRYTGHLPAWCLEHFPRCSATVDASLACMREVFRDVCAPRSAACAPGAACLFGIEAP